jgi:tetratricopeptide (TPR) repeat protein
MIKDRMQGRINFVGSQATFTFSWRALSAAIVLALLAVAPIRADTIYLKNGKTIFAMVEREDDKQLFLQKGDAEFSIPKSSVDHIQKGPLPSEDDQTDAASASAQSTRPPVPMPPGPTRDAPAASDSPAVHDGEIDQSYLDSIENTFEHSPTANSRRLVQQAYMQAALFASKQGNPEESIAFFRHALVLIPNDQTLTLALGYMLVKQGHDLEAVDLLLPATDRYPDSADIHLLLGSAFYGMENLDQAVTEWKKALAIHDDPSLRQSVEQAQREIAETGTYLEIRSSHFLVRYQGRETEQLSEQILKTLESDFSDLQIDLDYTPTEVIIVLLYPNQTFHDITRMPTWVGALNDGKLRIPVSGLTVVDQELARVLKHELTHSFVRQITLGKCPTWFNEGLAQLEEGATTTSYGSRLAKAFEAGKLPPLMRLERSFVGLPREEAPLSYAESLATLEFIRDVYGVGEIRRLLKAMPSAISLNSLFQTELRLSYENLQQEVANYVVRKYGA